MPKPHSLNDRRPLQQEGLAERLGFLPYLEARTVSWVKRCFGMKPRVVITTSTQSDTQQNSLWPSKERTQ